MSSGASIAYNGCVENDVPQVREGLRIASVENGRSAEYVRIQTRTLNIAVGRGSLDVIEYLLEDGGVPIQAVEPSAVAQPRSMKIIQLLLNHGWNINSTEPPQNEFSGPGKRLLHYLCDDEKLTRWLLCKGAIAKDPSRNRMHYPPLMEEVARNGTVDVFKLLLTRGGVQPTSRTLHCAVQGYCEAPTRKLGRQCKMLHYLVSQLRYDVNELDSKTDVFGPGYGTPLCYAISSQGSVEFIMEAVRYLFAMGASPNKTNLWGVHAVSLAKEKQPQVYKLFEKLSRHTEGHVKCERCIAVRDYRMLIVA